jgi:hypothetical protein
MEKNYAKISFYNCGLDYDYTICEWIDVSNQIDAAEIAFLDDDPNDHEEYGKPKIEIEPILMTDQEFSYWFKINMEDEA